MKIGSYTFSMMSHPEMVTTQTSIYVLWASTYKIEVYDPFAQNCENAIFHPLPINRASFHPFEEGKEEGEWKEQAKEQGEEGLWSIRSSLQVENEKENLKEAPKIQKNDDPIQRKL